MDRDWGHDMIKFSVMLVMFGVTVEVRASKGSVGVRVRFRC